MKKRNKTFIIFSPAFPSGEDDSAWVPSLQTFVAAVNRNFPGLKVIVFAFQYPYSTKAYSWNNNTVIPFNGFYKGRAARFFMWLKIWGKVKKIKNQNDVIGIFSQWCTECTFIAKYVSKFFKLRYYCWIHGGDARATNTYVKRIRPASSSLIAMSDFLADEFYKNHNLRPQYVVPNGIDISLFKNMPLVKDIDVIGVGAFSVLKQYSVFVEIVAALKKNIPGIKTILCGDGEERTYIETMITDLVLNENVMVTGFLPHTQSIQMMQRSKILLHPSSYEGFSGACLEALYSGAHVISFIKPMKHEIKNWHIVKTKEEMLQMALTLLKNADLRYERVLAYSMNESAKEIMSIFNA